MGVEEIKETIMQEQRILDQIDGASPKKSLWSWKNHKYCRLMSDIQIEIIGLIAAVFTTIAFVPQVVKITKNALPRCLCFHVCDYVYGSVFGSVMDFDRQYCCYYSQFCFGYITIGHNCFCVDPPQEQLKRIIYN